MNIDQTLTNLAAQLDISPSDFNRAKQSYDAIGKWLDGGNYRSGRVPSIYPQGSFRLGTVIRPYRNSADGDYDIDLVCELTQPNLLKSPKILKDDIGDRIKEHGTYNALLEPEGRRCWTLTYAAGKNGAGFHLDVLPAISSEAVVQGKIDITDQVNANYSWSTSNPGGYYRWFKSVNQIEAMSEIAQRQALFESNREIFESIDAVPKQLLRTPLQRGIQILKRHRDVFFNDKEFKPISIIITTICGRLYEGGDIEAVLETFAHYSLRKISAFIAGQDSTEDTILIRSGGEWLIPNPVYLQSSRDAWENFADKWNENEELPRAFFSWVIVLWRHLSSFKLSNNSNELMLETPLIGNPQTTAESLFETYRSQERAVPQVDTDQLLDLIHLAIDGKAEWAPVESLARSLLDSADNREFDVDVINYAQVLKHQGKQIPSDLIRQLSRIQRERSSSAVYNLCLNLLMDSATDKMLVAAINVLPVEGQWPLLTWPILRLKSDWRFIDL